MRRAQFTAEALRVLQPGGVFFVVVPDYLKERGFFWDIDYTHNFVDHRTSRPPASP